MLSCDARLFPINIPRCKLYSKDFVHVKTLVPVRVQRLLYDRGRSSLLSSYCSNCKWIWEPYNSVNKYGLSNSLDGVR